MGPEAVSTNICIAGGGPAGMMLGFLMARAGIDVVVLEKHADFLRDFRGDTIHPSTLEVMHELGLLDELLKLPHQKAPQLTAQLGDLTVTLLDFTHLPTRCQFIVFMPQWDFLNFLAEQAARYPTFKLQMGAEVTDLIEDGGRIAGVRATTGDGRLEIHANLIVGADGRHSVIRSRAGLKVDDLGAPMDVLWFRLSRRRSDPEETMGRFDTGRIFIMINRAEYWQCGFVIPKGSITRLQEKGLQAFRDSVAQVAPFAADRVGELREWEAVSLLTVRVDRLRQWYRPGLLCLGDAAHAMSPIGGVGINLAIQDAIAAANALVVPLREGQVTQEHLHRVQRRRDLPTRMTQWGQVFIQNRVVTRVLSSVEILRPPLPLRLVARFPFLRRSFGRLVGMGIRPEHVNIPAISSP